MSLACGGAQASGGFLGPLFPTVMMLELVSGQWREQQRGGAGLTLCVPLPPRWSLPGEILWPEEKVSFPGPLTHDLINVGATAWWRM